MSSLIHSANERLATTGRVTAGAPAAGAAALTDVPAGIAAAVAQGREAAMAAVAALTGAFAFGHRDAASGRTLLAVDRFAMRTLCYRLQEGALRFGERADELVASDDALDPQAIFDYLYFHCIPSPRTVFRDVLRLPAGHMAWFERGELTVAPYWTASFEDAGRAPVSFDALQGEFRATLEAAVKRDLDGDAGGIPACFLSGGTDSSTVAGMIGKAAGQPAHTYSIGFEAQGYDEMAFARIAAKHFGTVHHEYYVTPDDLVKSIAEVAQSYDQPFGNSSALPAYYCAKVARGNGVTRMLAGDGGDELFGGNSRYAKQRIFGWYQGVPAPLRTGLLEPLLERTPLGNLPLLKKGKSYIEQAKVPMPERDELYNLVLRLGLADVLMPEFLARIDERAPARLRRQVWEMAKTGSEVNRTLAFDWRFTLADSDLPKVRVTTALAGVGVRFPFLADEVLAFSLRLPADYKLRGLKLRWFFKEALRGFLPDEIITKKKQGFGLPFGVWATKHAALKALALDSLASLSGRGIVRPGFITTLVEKRLPEHPGYYGEMVWILMMLEQWLRRVRPGGGALF
ncbi:MAG: asparagine synthase [Burkholderiales bacterium]|nr:asparagine synthase [Burkholderiales bacterium]